MSQLQKVFLPLITQIYFTDNELFAKYRMTLIAKNFVFRLELKIQSIFQDFIDRFFLMFY